MDPLLAQKKSKSSHSVTSTALTDRRSGKSIPYRDPRYSFILESMQSYLSDCALGITEQSKKLCSHLLSTEQVIPENSLFREDLFDHACGSILSRNKARILRDLTLLLVSSAETLCIYGSKHLDVLTEAMDEGWNNSIPLSGPRPQPDYAVGFIRGAFTNEQLSKLSPFLGDYLRGDRSYFMATYRMFFPFLTCEVKCGAGWLEVADHQNAHSMTLSVRGVSELFRRVKREDEVHREILAFSISHDNRNVLIYGHYAFIDKDSTKYYRHVIRNVSFTDLNGKKKWTSYRFIKNVYDYWMPMHLARIRSAIDDLPKVCVENEGVDAGNR